MTCKKVSTIRVITEMPNDWHYYRKKPIVIKAIKMEVPFKVQTMEGWLKGKANDYLIEGIAGELYPCDEKIFKQTYEVTALALERELK